MDLHIRLVILGMGVILFAAITLLMIRRKSNESISLVWMLVAILSIIIGIFPHSVNFFTNFFRIDYPPTFVIIIAIIFLMIFVFYLSNKLAEAENKISEQAMQISLLNNDLIEIKTVMEKADAANVEKGVDELS